MVGRISSGVSDRRKGEQAGALLPGTGLPMRGVGSMKTPERSPGASALGH